MLKDMIREEMKKAGIGRDVRELLLRLRAFKEDTPKTPREVALQSASSGALNAAIEGVLVGMTCHEYVREGVMTGKEASKKVLVGASSGFVTSASGTAVTYGVARYLGSTGPVSIAAGMAASAGSRYMYSKFLKRVGVEELDTWIRALSAQDNMNAPEDSDEDDEEDDDEE